MQFKSIFFLSLFILSIVGPVGASLLVENGEFFAILINEEDQSEDCEVYISDKNTQTNNSEYTSNFKLALIDESCNFSEKHSFWNSIYSETFYPPPEFI